MGRRSIGSLHTQNGARDCAPAHPRWLYSTPLPINAFVQRELCAEFQLLEITCDQLFATMAANGATSRSEVSGDLQVFVTGACCISCVGAVRQFQLLWPSLSVSIGMSLRNCSLFSIAKQDESPK